MSASRPPSTPPTIQGFEYVQLLGKGGFADVFLYQQQMPKRRVAVKVLLADAMNPSAVSDFKAEANTMAQFSTHPAIVTIYHADVAPDGRPYLVMEHCPKPNLQARYRKAPFSVAEALRVGIQVSGAVQTAHRAGILHRDIKPANILVTEYNRPALADFGIAATTSGTEESLGMSPPWSPPEAFSSPPVSDVTTDLWALGATVYTLLAGRSPFEVSGQKNSTADVIARIQHEPLRPIDRADVPTSLQAVFVTAMAKDPARRYSSAVDFARALQKVQIELAMSVTPFDVIDDGAEDLYDEPEDDGRTRVRSVVSIDPQGPARPAFPSSASGALPEVPFSTTDAAVLADSTGTPLDAPPVSDATVIRGRGSSPQAVAPPQSASLPDDATLGRTQMRPRPAEPAAEPAETPDPVRRKAPLMIGLGVAVVVVGVATAAVLGVFSPPSDDGPEPEHTSVVPQDDVVVAAQVPIVDGIVGTIDADAAVFTWEAPDAEPGDTFLWGIRVGDAAVAYEAVDEPTATVPFEGEEVCIEVLLRRADGRTGATPGVGCAP